MLYKGIKQLVQYGASKNFYPPSEAHYVTNLLLELFHEDNYEDVTISNEPIQLENILKVLLDEAVARGLIEDSTTYRDIFDTKLMNTLLPRPSQVQANFSNLYEKSPLAATDYYYQFSKDSDYIRTYRVEKDQKWIFDSTYGPLDITINLSKPEKDPKAIALAKTAKAGGYPKCLLCIENEGYAGNVHHPGRSNHRVIPIFLNESDWGFQYSPYVYYNEHCIVFNQMHTPMKIDRYTFVKLLDFVDIFPHYFLGSNADLPIVGGSILSHDHFQGGHYTFAMERAEIEEKVIIKGFEEIEAGIVNWPMSVLRLRGKDKLTMIDLAEHILLTWREYEDKESGILAYSKGEPHNTITPIVRMREGLYEIDLVLRNNRTSEEHPLGIFHPHANLHHIKKENIGLIEVMGLAVLPSRLKEEMKLVQECILKGEKVSDNPSIAKHGEWVESFLAKDYIIDRDNIEAILQTEIGQVFQHVLEDAGVYKCTPAGREGFGRFIKNL